MKMNKQMIAFKAKIFQILDDRQAKGLFISSQIIEDIMNGKMALETSDGATNKLLPFIDAEFGRMVKKGFSRMTIANYRTFYGHLNEFMSRNNLHDIPIQMVDSTFIREFDTHLINRKNLSLGRVMTQNSVNKYHSLLKALLNVAQQNQYISRNPYQRFKLKRVVRQLDFLSEQEIIKITGLQFDNQSLERTRDYLLFMLWTGGIRASDLFEFRPHNIFEQEGFHFLRLTGQSTNNAVCTPLLPGALAIFKKYKTYQDETGFGFPVISQQKLNANLKIIGELSGINKVMTNKIARHSWERTICLRNGVPPHVTTSWSGRKPSSYMTNINVQATEEESIYWLKKLYELYNKPEFITK